MRAPDKAKPRPWWVDADQWYGDFTQTPELSELVVEKTILAAAKGDIGEYAMLSDGAREAADWFAALLAIDERNDPRLLLKLLQRAVPQSVFPHLADLFKRKLVPQNRGRPRAPSYARVEGPEPMLRNGLAHVNYLVQKKGMPLSDALNRVAYLQNIPLDLLKRAQAGRRGSSHRAKKSSAQN